MSHFDKKIFVELSGSKLCSYADEFMFGAPDSTERGALEKLIKELHELDELHVFFVLRWGVRANIDNIADLAIDFLNRSQPWHSPQLEVIRLLGEADGATVEHLDSIKVGTPKIMFGHPFPLDFEELIQKVRMKLLQRSNRATQD